MGSNFVQDYTLRVKVDPKSLDFAGKQIDQWVGKTNKRGEVELKINTKTFEKDIQALSNGDIDIERALKGLFAKKYNADTLKHDAAILDGVKKIVGKKGYKGLDSKELMEEVFSDLSDEIQETLLRAFDSKGIKKDILSSGKLTDDIQKSIIETLQKALALESGKFTLDGRELKLNGLFNSLLKNMSSQMESIFTSPDEYKKFFSKFGDISKLFKDVKFNPTNGGNKELSEAITYLKDVSKTISKIAEQGFFNVDELKRQSDEIAKDAKAVQDQIKEKEKELANAREEERKLDEEIAEQEKNNNKKRKTANNTKDENSESNGSSGKRNSNFVMPKVVEVDTIRANKLTVGKLNIEDSDTNSSSNNKVSSEISDSLDDVVKFLNASISYERRSIKTRQDKINKSDNLDEIGIQTEKMEENQRRLTRKLDALEHFKSGEINQSDLDVIQDIINRRTEYNKGKNKPEEEKMLSIINQLYNTINQGGASKSGIGHINTINSKLNMMKTTMEYFEQAGEHIEDILDHSADYVKNMSNLMGTFGKSSHGEVGYSIFDYGYSKGRSLSGDYYNMLSPVDFHSHPYLPNVDDLLPSAQDIKAYAYEFRTQLSNYSKTFLKEAYISNGDKLLKMDFNNLDPKAIDNFERDLLEALASVASQYSQEYVVRDSKGAVKNVMYPAGDLGNKITRESRAAMSQVFEKYGLKMGVATRDRRGNLIDDISGEKWTSTMFGEFKSDASLIHEASLLQWQAAQLISKTFSDNANPKGGQGASKSSAYTYTGIEDYTVDKLNAASDDINSDKRRMANEYLYVHNIEKLSELETEYLQHIEKEYADRIKEVEDMYEANHHIPTGDEADSLKRLKMMHSWVASTLDKNIQADYGDFTDKDGKLIYNEEYKKQFVAYILSMRKKIAKVEEDIDYMMKTLTEQIPTVKELQKDRIISNLKIPQKERDELLAQRDEDFNSRINQINRNVPFGSEYKPLIREALGIIEEQLVELKVDLGKDLEGDRKNGDVTNYTEYLARVISGYLSGNDYVGNKIAAPLIIALKQNTDATSLLSNTLQTFIRVNGDKELRYTYNRLTDDEYRHLAESGNDRYDDISFTRPLTKSMILKLGEAVGMQMDDYKAVQPQKDPKTGQTHQKYMWMASINGFHGAQGSGWTRFLHDFATILNKIVYKNYYEKTTDGKFIEAARTGLEDPQSKGWYELVNGKYVLTGDTKIASYKPEDIYGPLKKPLDYGMSQKQSDALFDTILNAARKGLEARFNNGFIDLDYTVSGENLKALEALGVVQNLPQFINPDKTMNGAAYSYFKSIGLEKILDSIVDGSYVKNKTVLTDNQIEELRDGFVNAQLGKGLFGMYEFMTHRVMNGIRSGGRVTPDQVVNFGRGDIDLFNSIMSDWWSRTNSKLYRQGQKNHTTDFMEEQELKEYETVEKTLSKWNDLEEKFEDVVDSHGNAVKEQVSVLSKYNGKTLDETFSAMLNRTPEDRLKELDDILSKEMVEGYLSYKGKNKLLDKFGIDIPKFQYLDSDYLKAIRNRVKEEYNMFSPEDIRILKEFGVNIKGLTSVGYIEKFDELIASEFKKTQIVTDGDKETYEGHFTTEGLRQLMTRFDVPLEIMEKLDGLTESSIISSEDIEKLRSVIMGRPQHTRYDGVTYQHIKNPDGSEGIMELPQKGDRNLNIELQKENLDKLFEEEFKNGKFTAKGLQQLVDDFGVSIQRGGMYFDELTKKWVDGRYTITPDTVVGKEELADIKSRALSNILFSSDDNLVGKNISEEIIAQMRRRAEAEANLYTVETARLKNAREIFLAEQAEKEEILRALPILSVALGEMTRNVDNPNGLPFLESDLGAFEESAANEKVEKKRLFDSGVYRVGVDGKLFDELSNAISLYMPELFEEFKKHIDDSDFNRAFDLVKNVYDSSDTLDANVETIVKQIIQEANQNAIKHIYNEILAAYNSWDNYPQEIKDAEAERDELIARQQELARLKNLNPADYGMTSRQIGALRGQRTKLGHKIVDLDNRQKDYGEDHTEEINKLWESISEIDRKLGPFALNTQALTEEELKVKDALREAENKIKSYYENYDLDTIDGLIDSKRQARHEEENKRFDYLNSIKAIKTNIEDEYKKKHRGKKYEGYTINVDEIKQAMNLRESLIEEIQQYSIKKGNNKEELGRYYENSQKIKDIDKYLEPFKEIVDMLKKIETIDTNISQLDNDIKVLNKRKENINKGLLSEATEEYYSTPAQKALNEHKSDIAEAKAYINELRKNIEEKTAKLDAFRSFDEILRDTLPRAIPFSRKNLGNEEVLEANVNGEKPSSETNGNIVNADGGIIIHAPKVTIVDTDFTDILKADKVTVNADSAVGNFEEVTSDNKKEESKNTRSPIDKWKLDESIQAMDKMILKFNGILDDKKDKETYKSMLRLRENLVELSKKRSYTDEDIKKYKNYKGQIESLQTKNSILGDKTKTYNSMVKMQRDILTKSRNGANETIINRLKDSLNESLTKYADSNNITGKRKRNDLERRVLADAAKQIAAELKDDLTSKQNSLRDTFDTGKSQGKIYSRDAEGSYKEFITKSTNFISFLDQIINGEKKSVELIDDVFKQITTLSNGFGNVVDSIEANTDSNAIVNSNSVNSYIRTLSREGKKEALSYDSNLKEQLDANIKKLNDFNNRPDNEKTQAEYEEIKKESEALRTKVELLEQVRLEYQKTAELRREVSELESTGEDNEFLEKKKDDLKDWLDEIRDFAAVRGVNTEAVENILGTHDEYNDYADKLITLLQGKRKAIEDAMERKKVQGYGYTEVFQDQIDKDIAAANEFIKLLRNIGTAGKDSQTIINDATKLFDKLDRKDYINVQSDENVFVKKSQASKLFTKAEELYRNTKGAGLSKDQRAELDQLYMELRMITEAAKDSEGELSGLNRLKYDQLSAQISNLTAQYQHLGIYGTTALNKLAKSIAAQSRAMFARYFSLYDIIRYARTAINTVKELDTAMVELRKVSDATEKEYEQFRKEIRATATDIAATNKDLISSAADWSRLGYSIKEATELAKDAQLFVNVGDGVDISKATDMMITAMKAFNIEADKALSIVDKYNEIGNNYALSASDIGDAMQRSASVLAASNTSFDESIALITAGNEILQDPEKTGTALRTIALRIRGAKSELEEMGEETEYVVNSTSKLRELIKGYTSIGGKYEGFDIMENENTFKSLSDIIKGIGKVYGEMSDIDRTAMLEKLAGKNRSNALAAMLQNYEQIDNVLKSIENSEGSALEENAHIVDSVQGRLTILQTSAENFWQELINTDAIKEAISGLTEILNLVTTIVSKTGLSPFLTMGGGSALVYKLGGIQRYFDNRNALHGFTTIRDAAQQNQLEKQNIFDKVSESYNDNLDVAAFEEAQEDLAKATEETTQAQKALDRQTRITAQSFRSDLGKSLAGLGLSLVISAAVALISRFINKIKEAQKAARDMAKETQEQNKALDDYAQKIAEAHAVLDDEKSTTEQIIEAKKQLIDIQNELNDSYSNYNDIIKDVNSTLGETNDALIAQRMEGIQDTIKEAQKAKDFLWFGDSEYENAIETFFGDGEKIVNTDALEDIERQIADAQKIIDDYNNGKYVDESKYRDAQIALEDLTAAREQWYSQSESWQNFESIDDKINYYKQLMREAESGDTKQYKDAKKNYDKLVEAKEKYQDIALSYGENQAVENYNSEYYDLMQAYYKNLQDGTEESEAAFKTQLNDLWTKAAADNNLGVTYWLESMFDTFFDEINKAKIDERWNAIAEGNRSSHGQRLSNMLNVINNTQEGERKLTEADILSYLNGNELKNVSERQLEWLEAMKDEVDKAGYVVDEYGLLAKRFTEEGLVAVSYDEVNLDTEIAEARNSAVNSGLISEEEFDELGIDTSEELDKWEEIAKKAKDAEEAKRMYYLATAGFGATLDSSTILKNMQEQYKPAFDALAESYKEIFDDKNNYKGIDKITAEKLEGVRSNLEGISEKLKEAGLDAIPQDEINDFLDTLSTEDILDDSFVTKAEEVHAAYNNIATTIVDSLNPALGQASFETVNLMTKQLKQLGVANAEEVIFTRLGYTIDECSTAMDTYAAAKEAADAIDLDLDKDVSEFTAEEWAAISSDEAIMEYYRHRARLMAENISTVEDVQNLVNLTKALGDTTVGAIALAEAISRLDTINANTEKIDALNEKIQNAGRTGNWRGISEYQQQIDALKKENADIASSLFEDVKYEAEFASSEWDGNEVTSSTDKGSDSKQKFDWIERAIKKIQRAVTNLGKVADATYKTWGERLDAIMGKTEEFHDELGRYGAGNIDLYNRPQYINEDGSVSTVRSMSFGDEFGNEILVPTIAFDDNGNPYSMSDDEAIARYYETGEYLGLFKSIEEADEYAEKLHEQQEAIYTGNDNFYAGKYQKLKEEIALQEQASQAYMAEAKAVGLSAEYISKIQNGKMDIETVTDEKLKEAISDYQEYYDKATDAADAVEDLRGEIAQLAQTKFDMITKQFEEMALAIDHAATRIGHIQSKMEAEGYFESSALIKQLKAGNEAKLEQLKEEALELAASIDEAVTNGDIEYGSEQWWGMYDSLQNVNDQIVEMSSTIADLNDQLRQMEWDNFDYIADAVHRLVDENEFLIDVLQDESLLFEKNAYIGEDLYANGNMSDAALAVQGLHVNSMQVLEQQNEKYANEIKKINAELANDPNNKKLLERRNDLIDQQQDIIKGITSEKQAIKELIKEGYETFLDYLQKSIDYRKKALEAQKSLYDYQNTVEDQTKTISSYRKQLAALGGDDSEENQARLQTLADNLNKAEKELQQTEYERWLSDQEEMMDNLYDQFDKLISDKLDQTDELISRAVEQTESGSKNISDTITSEFNEFLYELDNTSFGVNMDDRMSNAISAVNSVENAIGNMVEAANVNAQNELRALEALAQTVADSAVQRPSYESQVPASTGGSGGSGGNGGTSLSNIPPKTALPDHTEEIKSLNNQLRELERLYDNALQMNHHYSQRAGKSPYTSERNSLLAQAGEYANKASEYKKKIDAIEKQINQLKNAKYAKGGTIGNAIKKTGEDGIILARSGEEVLSLERVKQMQEIFKMMQPLTNMGSNSMFSSGTTVNGMNVSFDLPNVANYEDFVRQAKSDPTFEKLVQSMTIGASLGKSKLSKYSI